MFLSSVLKPSLLALGLCVPALTAFTTLTAMAQEAQKSQKSQEPQEQASKLSPQSANQAAKQLVNILQVYDSLEGGFTQTLSSNAGKVLQTTQGRFKIKRPGLYLWQSAEPYPQTIVGNGETIWVYDPDLEQVTITPQSQMPFNPAMLLSGGIADLSARFTVVQKSHAAEQNVQRQSFHLVPINTVNAPFAAVDLTFSNNQIVKAVLTDRLGQQTVMTFADLTVNTLVDDALFTFVPPKGTDVLMNE